MHKLAVNIGDIGKGPGFGPYSADRVGANPLVPLANVISAIIGFITIAAGIYFMFQFLIGGFEWLSASGDKSRLTKAQDRLSHALIGFIIVVGAYAIIFIMQTVLGIDILLQNPDDLIKVLKIGGLTTP